ncbi:BTB/POZ domain-containing protein 6-like [Armigeres subalbatus]|uniref:BTB/POZ domain-containing protein 6-like n=1 Tax=Armigeres subalbatus TaxID=124917 RepID=UPI002ED57466
MANQFEKSQWQQLVNSKVLSDVSFAVGSNSTLIYGHRSLIAAASDVFFQMFAGDLAPTNGEVITVPDIESEIFLEMMKFIYYDDAAMTADNLVKLYYAAEKYNLIQLKQQCHQFITDHEDSMLLIFKNNLEYGFEMIDQVCYKIIHDKPFKMFKSPEFLELPLEAMRKICSHRALRCNTDQLVEAMQKWEDYEYEHRQGAVDKLKVIIDKQKQQSRYHGLRKICFFGPINYAEIVPPFIATINIEARLNFKIYGVGLYVGVENSNKIKDNVILQIVLSLRNQNKTFIYTVDTQIRKDVYIYDLMFEAHSVEADSQISLKIEEMITSQKVMRMYTPVTTTDNNVMAIKFGNEQYYPGIAYILYES